MLQAKCHARPGGAEECCPRCPPTPPPLPLPPLPLPPPPLPSPPCCVYSGCKHSILMARSLKPGLLCPPPVGAARWTATSSIAAMTPKARRVGERDNINILSYIIVSGPANVMRALNVDFIDPHTVGSLTIPRTSIKWV